MELAYVCEWEKRPKSVHCPSVPLVCSWSCRNLVAFTTDLKSDTDDTVRSTNPVLSLFLQSGSTNFGEKFSRVKFSPSLTLFGGKPMEGWLAVTVSGLVTVSLLKPGGALLTASESLCRLRGRVALADIAFTGGGNIVVAATDGSSSSPVQFYKVVVSVVSEKCRIDTELLPSLFLRCTTDPLRRDKYPAVTHLKFLTRENSEQVLLCASNQSGSIVECWSLRKEGLPVNNIFQHRSPVGKNPGGNINIIIIIPLSLSVYLSVCLQVLATRILAVKASLCKLSTATAARACDFHAKLLLIAISSTLKSLLRPHVLNTPDKSPGDRLAEICSKNIDTDIDKVMINLKTEEFVLDGPPLQSLQQLIQWVGDFVLYLLANLPNQGSMVRPGFGFMRDGASLAMLREMLVMIRIWGLLKPGCLPTFTATSDNQDSMQLLFRLLTKLWLCSRDDVPPQDPDETLIDECCLLPSQLLVPSMDWLPVNDGIIVRLQGKQPIRLQFGKASSLPAGGSTAATPLELFTR
ncbi:mediator of RNA polymerase II transcription subunit 16 [Etheostoma cragini]|uniref:mediator of RNA polymerase II transcription subunit 16 n=1 Tax=Etheostoma cragini TaxID=417921 RepID=UPI00155E5993|nr:mediator of RNA polymerase II transcription subunit 16 [Etheostoma cragini]